MSSHLSRRRFLEAAVATAAWPQGGFSQSRRLTAPPLKPGGHTPRGLRRILYVSDPSSIARRYLPDPVSEQDLRNWVDTLAASRVDLFIQEAYTQGWTTYCAAPGSTMTPGPSTAASFPCWTKASSPWGSCWTSAATGA